VPRVPRSRETRQSDPPGGRATRVARFVTELLSPT
jgi:hypothetical protein